LQNCIQDFANTELTIEIWPTHHNLSARDSAQTTTSSHES
jgi:hypothetical protein